MSVSLPTELLRRADAHVRAGRLEDAAADYSQVVALHPDRADAWFNLAWAQRMLRRFDAALASYAAAIAAGIARPEEAHANRAAILSDHLARPDLALAELEIALRLDPRFVTAWLNTGYIHEDRGNPDAARAAYRHVVALDPTNGRAQARLAMIDIATGHAATAAERLQRLVGVAMPVEDRAEMLFALGNAFDDVASYNEAFQAFEAANWLAASIAPRRYDPAAQERLVDALIQAYPAQREGAPAQPDETAAPIFICGMFRSGSTLAERILARHDAVSAGGELEQIPALALSVSPYPQAAAGLGIADAARLRRDYLNALPGHGRVTDKRCDNFLHIGLIKTLFPEARIVHTTRHPLDTLLSIHFLHFGEGVTYGHDLSHAAHYFVQYRRLMAHWERVYPGEIATFDYDRLVSDPRSEVAGVLEYLGLPWEHACLTATETSDAIRTASAWQVRRPIFSRSSGRWRHYEGRLGGVRALLAHHGITL